MVNPPRGCRFAPRCAYARDRCHEEEPPLMPAEDGDHVFACWYPVGSPEYHARRAELGAAAPEAAPSADELITLVDGEAHSVEVD
jgi:hypothetical protein